MEYVSVQDCLRTFNKEALIGKCIKFDKNNDPLNYDLDRFKDWLDRHFIIDVYDHFQYTILFEIVYVKESFCYSAPQNFSNN
jgi:hypothetical protein